MRRSSIARPSDPKAGFTLIELLIVIGIIGLLAAVLLPRVLESREATYAASDQRQLGTHYTWLTIYQQKNRNFLPSEGGHKFVMTTWTSKIFEHTPENLDRYFTPGHQDPQARLFREEVEKGDDPWPTINDVQSDATHYVGRAKAHLRTAMTGGEAWMANDNEGGWSLPDGTINILMSDGNVRIYSYLNLSERFGLGERDKDNPVQTWGANSPIPECQKLDF